MSINTNKNKKDCNAKYRNLILLSLLMFPITFSFFVVSLHSETLIGPILSIILLIISVVSICLLMYSVITYRKLDKVNSLKRLKKNVKIILSIFFCLYICGATTVLILLYGPIDDFKVWFVTTISESGRYGHLATWVYSDETITDVLENNRVIESGESTNPDLINIITPKYNQSIYENEYEEAVLSKDEENQIYKVIDIDRDGMRGKLVVVYDASKVKLATAKYVGYRGEYLIDILNDNNGLIGMNASAFTFASGGAIAQGTVIVDGKIISDEWRKPGYGGMIGMTYDNKLYLGKEMTPKQALAANIRDAVEYGPFLIVNGVPSYVKGTGGGTNPRAAIGQRQDGIMLLLVIDGRKPGYSRGAKFGDLSEIMMDYGAYNAANLDGGTSAAIAEDGKLITVPDNDISTKLPNAWIVTE